MLVRRHFCTETLSMEFRLPGNNSLILCRTVHPKNYAHGFGTV